VTVAPDQQIRFLESAGGRVAYATVGAGPPLVLPAPWIGHLELERAFPEYRAFVTALAREHIVVRYDRPGTGLSDRRLPDTSPEADLATLEALVAALAAQEVALLGISQGGSTAAAFAARHPEAVRALVAVGAFAAGAEAAPAPLREAMLSTVRAHWGAGSRMLADVWVPGAGRPGSATARRCSTPSARSSASPPTCARSGTGRSAPASRRRCG
jgi:pimeloyl-ACP methyl ester carboxylesterase